MSKQTEIKPDYGNWVSKRLLYVSGTPGLAFLGLSFWLPILIILALFFILAFLYFIYARHQFSPDGGNLQEKIRNLVSTYLDWGGHGQALDIGCGNGALAIELAKKFSDSKVTGIDNWGGGWDYSQNSCAKNAELEGVSKNVTFQKASASGLPFNDESYDAVVSNFVFHEVTDTLDKRKLIKEALRVVKKGGVFSFQDLFLVKKIYGEMDDLLDEIKCWGVERVACERTNNLDFIPWALKLPFMVGEIGIIHGKK